MRAGDGIGHCVLSVDDDGGRRIGIPEYRRNKIGRKFQGEPSGIGWPRQRNICSGTNDGQLRRDLLELKSVKITFRA